jgi:hypothetical protein
VNSPRKSNTSTKMWRWTSRSGIKSHSESDVTEGYRQPSPKTVVSPYRSEEAHVLSLQKPANPRATRSYEITAIAGSRSPTSGYPAEESSKAVPIVAKPKHKVLRYPRVNLYRRARRGIEAAFGHRQKEASYVQYIYQRARL